jgi:hypothetical protein
MTPDADSNRHKERFVSSLTITLTGRAPIKIDTDEWPILASAKWHDGQVECQANRTRKLIVREHQDGRVVVYGIYDTQWQSESGRRRGEYLADCRDDLNSPIVNGDRAQKIVDAIHKVSEDLDFNIDLAEECIADLPAEDID